MSKVDIKRIDSLSANDSAATAAINENFDKLQKAVENTVSRDGTTPNFMDANLDLNSYRIINCGSAVDDNDVVTLKDVKDQIGDAVVFADRAEAAAIKSESSAQASEVAAANSRLSAAASAASAKEAADTVDGFDAHAEEAKNNFDVNALTLTARFDNNALDKTNEFNANAQAMTDGYNTNAMLKIDDFDAHAMTKEIEFDDNAAAKQAQVDASATAAKQSETNAKVSEVAAKTSELNSKESERRANVWAEGTDSEVAGIGGEKSAKGWANKAAEIVGAGVIQDDTISLKTTYSSDKLEKIFAVNEDHDSVLDCLDVLDTNIGAKTTVPLSSLLAIDSDARPSHKAKGAEVYDEFGTMGIIDSVTPTEAVIITKESREKVRIVDTLDIQKNGLDQYYVDLNSNQIRNEIIKGKIVQLRFDDVITNTGEQLYPFETFDKDGYAVFRRNVITADKAERINIKVDYQGIVTFDTAELQKADIDLANTGRITNCITSIPQDIKLELKDETLTLKAGSKVYYPDGTNYIISNDITTQAISSTNAECILFLMDKDKIQAFSKSNCYSGDTKAQENLVASGPFFFNFETGKVYYSSGLTDHKPISQWLAVDRSLPFALAHTDSTKITSIDQVFNGFGYIGSTVFALPGVKGLIPDGRNTDGSLRSKEYTINNVLTHTIPANRVTNIAINGEDISNVKLDRMTFSTEGWDYSHNENLMKFNGRIRPWSDCGAVTVDSTGRITSFNPKQVFHALDYNDAVHKTGDENISGIKTFTDDVHYKSAWIATKDFPEARQDTIPAQTEYTAISLNKSGIPSEGGDGFNVWISGQRKSDGHNLVELCARQKLAGKNEVVGVLGVAARQDGYVWAWCPTPGVNSAGNEIATAAWVRGKSVVIDHGYTDNYWFRRYSDGWLEQGGRSAPQSTVTFLRPFKSTNYVFVCAQSANSRSNDGKQWISYFDKKNTSIRISAQTLHNGNVNDEMSWFASGLGA